MNLLQLLLYYFMGTATSYIEIYILHSGAYEILEIGKQVRTRVIRNYEHFCWKKACWKLHEDWREKQKKGKKSKGAQESGTYKECAYGKPDIRYWI